jgi:hypothetical protein
VAGVPPFKAVLVLMVIGDNQIDVRPDCVLRTSPEYLQNPVGGKIGVIDDAAAISAGPPPQPNLPALRHAIVKLVVRPRPQ